LLAGWRMLRTAVIIRTDLTYKLRKDLVKYEIPEIWVEIGEARKKEKPNWGGLQRI
jgi:hypothetical protein